MSNDLKAIKLSEEEKKIHVIWIGKLPDGELDNLKIWANFNQDYEINIWIDSQHSLVPLLKQLIIKNTSDIFNNEIKNNPLSAAKLQVEFNNGFLKQSKTFNEYATQFIIDRGWKKQSEIDEWLNEGKTTLDTEKASIKKYTNSKILIRDVSSKKSNLFKDKIYYEKYLQELEESHFVVQASDLLRYQILEDNGGVYLDTDMLPSLNFAKIKEDNPQLRKFLEENFPKEKIIKEHNFENILINELIKLNFFNKLNEKELNILKNKISTSKLELNLSIDVLIKLSSYIKNINLDSYIKESLRDLILYEPLNCAIFSEFKNGNLPLYNSFILSKKNSQGIKDIKRRIEQKMNDRYRNLSSIKDHHVLHLMYKIIDTDHVIKTTGPGVFQYLQELEETITPDSITDNNRSNFISKFPDLSKETPSLIFDICSLDSLNSLQSTWFEERTKVNDTITELTKIAQKFENQKLLSELQIRRKKLLLQFKEGFSNELKREELQKIEEKIFKLEQELEQTKKEENTAKPLNYEEAVKLKDELSEINKSLETEYQLLHQLLQNETRMNEYFKQIQSESMDLIDKETELSLLKNIDRGDHHEDYAQNKESNSQNLNLDKEQQPTMTNLVKQKVNKQDESEIEQKYCL